MTPCFNELSLFGEMQKSYTIKSYKKNHAEWYSIQLLTYISIE